MSDNDVFFSSSSSSSYSQHHNQSKLSCLKTFSNPLKIILKNKKQFLTIYTLTALPLSLITFTLIFITTPTRAHIFHLETHVAARLSSTRLEATHVRNEARSDAVQLLRLKSFFFLPCFLLSLTAAISAVNSTSAAFTNKNPTFHSAVNAVRVAWKRVSFTAMYGYVVMMLYGQVPLFVAGIVKGMPVLRFLVLVIGSGFEVYVMGVLSVGLVVSVLEERFFGWGAIQVGSGLMKGRWVFGWGLTGGFVGLTGWIGWCMERIMKEGGDKRVRRDWKGVAGLIMSDWRAVGFIGLYGSVIVMGFVVVTVFYCECRRGALPLSHHGNSAPCKNEYETEIEMGSTSEKGSDSLMVMVDPLEAKRLAAIQMQEIQARGKPKRSQRIEAINGTLVLIGLRAGFVIEGRTGKFYIGSDNLSSVANLFIQYMQYRFGHIRPNRENYIGSVGRLRELCGEPFLPIYAFSSGVK